MNKAKRWLALALCLLLAVSTVVPAFAEEDITEPETVETTEESGDSDDPDVGDLDAPDAEEESAASAEDGDLNAPEAEGDDAPDAEEESAAEPESAETPDEEADETAAEEDANRALKAPARARTKTAGGTCGSVTWELYDDGELLIKPTQGDTGSFPIDTGYNVAPWLAYKDDIETVTVEGTCKTIGNSSQMFYNCSNLTEAHVAGLDVSGATSLFNMFGSCPKLTFADVANWDTSNVTVLAQMFLDCESLKTVDVSRWDTGSVEYVGSMFSGCMSLTSVDLSKWDTHNMDETWYMFCNCKQLKTVGDLGGWNTDKMTSTTSMFSGCESLTSVEFLKDFDTSNIYEMRDMFYGCSSLKQVDFSNWDMQNHHKDINRMFMNCTALEEIKLGKGTVIPSEGYYVFRNCSSLTELDLSNWDTRDTTYAYYIPGRPRYSGDEVGEWFTGCTSLSKVKLGENFSFSGGGFNGEDDKIILPTPTGEGTTGKWMLENTKNSARTPEELRDEYNASLAGTWVWQYEYDVEFDPNGGEGSMDTLTAAAGDDLTLPTNTFTNANANSFLGWAKSADATEPEFTDGEEIEALSMTGNETITLYAVWEPITYTVSFAPNGGSGDMESVSVVKDDAYTLPENGFTAPEGKLFDGWDQGAVGDSITVTEDVTVVAQWKDIPTYAFVEGMDGEWTRESETTLDFKVRRSEDDDTAFDHFTCIEVDGEVVDGDNYTAQRGSVDLSLKTDYLETLVEGEHTLTALFDDGKTETTFTVLAAPVDDPTDDPADDGGDSGDSDDSGNSDGSGKHTKKNSGKKNSSKKNSTSPKTGDESRMWLWLVTLVVVAICLSVAERKLPTPRALSGKRRKK